MTRRAFTLMELLVVIAIMGILGTVSVGGYRAMQRGMEDRGVMDNVSKFIRSAYQRAQIDRLPVNVYFWNETLREESDVETAIVVGKAIAVRRSGRFTKVQGSYLYDEFGDLNYNRLVLDEDDEDGMDASASGSTDQGEGIYLYKISGNEGSQVQRSLVSQTTKRFTTTEPLLLGGQGEMECYAYVLMDRNGVNWQTGDAYGFEFAELELPHGYIFAFDQQPRRGRGHDPLQGQREFGQWRQGRYGRSEHRHGLLSASRFERQPVGPDGWHV